MFSTYAPLALSLLPIFARCAPILQLDTPFQQFAGFKRDALIATQTQVVTSTLTTTSTTSATITSASSIPTNASPSPSSSESGSVARPTPLSAAAASKAPLVMAYYPDWAAIDNSKINFKLFDWIDFAFAVPDANFNLTWDDPKAPTLLRALVTDAHATKTKVKLSVGGWSGSQ